MPDMTLSPAALLNAPDLILLTILLLSAVFGAYQGLIQTVFAWFGRLAALAGAVWGAKLLAAPAARLLVTPLVGEIFADRAAALYQTVPETADALEQAVTRAAVSMAEGLSYLILLAVLLIVLTLAVGLIGRTLSLVSRIGPLGFLNRLGGLVLGLALGGVLCFLLLWALQAFAPAVLSELGWLSPARVADTVLTRTLLHYVPGYGSGSLVSLLAGLTAAGTVSL